MFNHKSTLIENYEDIIDSIQLYCSNNVGPKTFNFLIDTYGTPKQAIDQLKKNKIPSLKKIELFTRDKAKSCYDYVNKIGATVLLKNNKYFPKALNEIDDGPPLLFVKGNYKQFNTPCVAIVGARNCSINGSNFAFNLARQLTKLGLTIVSGMARGIDYGAHKGALYENITSKTIAVLAGGVDVIYPLECKQIYEKILEQDGAIISEMPPKTQIKANLFPRRNRIISAISKGVILIEAGKNSGSMITANFSLDYNKEVMVVPGAPYDPRSAGGNDLLKKGAAVITCAKDVIDCIGKNGLYDEKHISKEQNKSKEKKIINNYLQKSIIKFSQNELSSLIIAKIGSNSITIDEIASEISCDLKDILPILIELELDGRLVRIGGNKVMLVEDMEKINI